MELFKYDYKELSIREARSHVRSTQSEVGMFRGVASEASYMTTSALSSAPRGKSEHMSRCSTNTTRLESSGQL
jgi:hypothetical protein